MHNQRNFIQSQASAGPIFPVTLSPAQGMRASSNPESGQPHPQGSLPRHLPVPPGQFSAPRKSFPLPRLTPSTEVLEHIHPGSTSRGDFHSDPTAQDAMGISNSRPPNNFVAIPSRGLPGPFSYRPLPLPTQPVPFLNRMGTFDGNPPKGRRNPKKKASDDARMASSTGNGPRQASNTSHSKQTFTPQNIQMPFNPRSPPSLQEVHPSSKAMLYPGNYHHPGLPPRHHSGNWQEPLHHQPYHRQAPRQQATGVRSRERAMSNPFSPSALGLQGSTGDVRSTVPSLPQSTNAQHQITSVNEMLSEENSGLVSTQVRPHIAQPLDAHTFGHQLPDTRNDAQHQQDHVPEMQRPALAPVSNAGQPQLLGTPRRSMANEISRRSVQEGCTIWIGAIPNHLDRATLMDLLRPCRGLVDVSGPRVSSPSKARNTLSYAFAEYVIPVSQTACYTNSSEHSFQNPADAAEALERLPQTQFACLLEGTFLCTNYAKPKVYSSPGHYQHGGDGASKQPVANISPTKSRKDENTNHVRKSKFEHGRRLSKGSARGKKQPASSSEGNAGKLPERVEAVDADKESDPQPDEATVSPDLDGKARSTASASQSTISPDSILPTQDLEAIQPDVSVDPHATQASIIAGDGAQDTSSVPGTKYQVQERSSRHSEGCAKPSKRKSKGSNKLPVPEKKASEPPTAQTASGNANPKARAKPSMNETPQSLEDSGMVGKGNQAALQIEGSRVIAAPVPLEPMSTSKDTKIPDQSFLGRESTEVDGEEPNASVADAVKASVKDNEMEVSEYASAPLETGPSAAPLESSKESTWQPMKRDVSNSSHGSVDTARSILSYRGPPSSPQTERSSSISQEKLSPIVQAACPSLEITPLPHFPEPARLRDEVAASIASSSASRSGIPVGSKRAFEEYGQPQKAQPNGKASIQKPEPEEPPVQQESRNPISPNSSEMGGGTKYAKKMQSPSQSDIGMGPIEEDPEQTSSILLIQHSPSKSDLALSRGSARKRALSIPPRSSSLAAPSTPIKTHQKKKPRNLTPVTEASPSRVTVLPVDGTRMDSSLQPVGSTKLDFAVLTTDPAARTLTTDNAGGLPKPETPFLMDDGVRVTPPKISRHIVEASNAERYYAQKSDYQILHWGSATQIDATCYVDSSDSASPHPSRKSTPKSASAKNDLETTLREAGYRSLSNISPFTIKDPDLAWLEIIDDQGNPLDNRTNKDEPVLTWLDEKGKIGQVLSLEAWTKQHEMMEVVKKATAAKRLLAHSPPLPWTKIESIRQRLSQYVTSFSSEAHGQQTTKLTAQQTLTAEALLNSIPKRNASRSEMQKWSRKVSLFMEQNASEPTPFKSVPRESTTSSSKLSQGTSSQKRQQERRHPVLINQPDPQNPANKRGKDEAVLPTAITELNDSFTDGQTTESEPSPSTCSRRTPSEEDQTPPVALISATAFNQVTKLEDLYEMGKDCRRWSDDRHWSSTPQEDERMTSPDPEHKSLDGECTVRRVTQVKDTELEQRSKETENKMQQKPHVDKPGERQGNEPAIGERKQNQVFIAESDKLKDPKPAKSEEKVVQEAEGVAYQKQTSQLLDMTSPSFESNHTTSNEGISEEGQQHPPRGGHSPFRRSGYNAVAGRGIDGKRGRKTEASKDPWALPHGEKPWGSGCEGRGGRKGREGR